jgi:hypothetical protein
METTGRSADAVNGFSAIIYLVIACAPIYIRTLSPNDCFVSPAVSGGSGSWLVPTVVLPESATKLRLKTPGSLLTLGKDSALVQD